MKFVKNRQCIFKEICNMSKLNGHQNVLQLIEVLEYVQDSKSTIFLALELAAGGELFDRITIDRGTEEDTARQYYRQLLCGIQYCHLRGVCHRDLKPENLLLADNEDHPVLKIADFGLSALFRNGVLPSEAEQSIRRLRSVVGSPHYVAPEILTDNREGYEGAKADMWSSVLFCTPCWPGIFHSAKRSSSALDSSNGTSGPVNGVLFRAVATVWHRINSTSFHNDVASSGTQS